MNTTEPNPGWLKAFERRLADKADQTINLTQKVFETQDRMRAEYNRQLDEICRFYRITRDNAQRLFNLISTAYNDPQRLQDVLDDWDSYGD